MKNINYREIIELTDEEQLKLYMKCPKKELALVLIQCNKILKYILDKKI